MESSERSLLGKIWGEKEANYTGIKNTFRLLWCPKGDLKVVELGRNSYQFIFSLQEERDRALLRRPWTFDNQLLVLHPWKAGRLMTDDCFCRFPLWVQIRGIPIHWVSKEVGWKIGKLFPHCLNVILPENGSREGRILKILVELDLTSPLMRGTTIKLGDEGVWIDFKFEQLPAFCFLLWSNWSSGKILYRENGGFSVRQHK